MRSTHLVLLVLALSACADNAIGPASQLPTLEGAFRGEQGIFLTVDDLHAQVGTEVVFAVMYQTPADEELTPTGFRVDLHFDAERLAPVASLAPEGEGLRLVNLGAASGLIKGAGAAADGLEGDVLFGVKMRVLSGDFTRGLGLDVLELDVVERNHGDVSPQVQVLDVPLQGSAPVPMLPQPAETGGGDGGKGR